MLGDNIKKIMKVKGVSAKGLAEKLEITPTYLSYIMNDKRKPSFDMLQKIADALEITIHLLLAENTTEEKIKNFYENYNRIDSMTDKRKSFEELSEERILTVAAHKVGHEGPLTEEELEKIKLAIKIALAKNNKQEK